MSDHYKILVDLDALLDTRLATLASMDVGVANKVGQMAEYLTRYSDVFSHLDPSINDDEYRNRYLKRNSDILQYALSTDIIHLICMGLNEMLPSIHRGVIPQDVRLIINTYPYALSGRRLEAITNSLLYHTPYEIAIETTCADLYRLTPTHLGTTYKEWYTYDIEPWLVIHERALLQKPVTKMNIILPALSTSGRDPLAESFDVEPFKARELLFKPFMNLNYIDLRYFSYNHGFAEHIRKSGFLD